MTPLPARLPTAPPPMPGVPAQRGKKLDAPMPLSEFAKQSKRRQDHTGHGRRDQLTAGERTRILRMLRDEGGRIADEESQVHIGSAPPAKGYDFDFDDDALAPPPSTAPQQRPDVPAKPALVVGLAQARSKRNTGGPQRNTGGPMRAEPAPPRSRPQSVPPPVPGGSGPPPVRAKAPTMQPPRTKAPTMQPPGSRRPPPAPFNEKTRAQLPDEDLLAAVRSAPGPGRSLFDEPTRMGDVDGHLLDLTRPEEALGGPDIPTDADPRFLDVPTDLSPPLGRGAGVNSFSGDDEATRMASLESVSRKPPPSRSAARPAAGKRPLPRPQPSGNDERTRNIDIRKDANPLGDGINDPNIDWDID